MVINRLPTFFVYHRRALAGSLLFATVLLTLLVLVLKALEPQQDYVFLRLASGLSAFTAAAMLLPDVDRRQKRTVTALLVFGVALIWYGHGHGAQFELVDVLTTNGALLTMIMSVSTLKLITLPADKDISNTLPVGPQAFRNTLISVALFGSVINISAPVVIADRLHAHRALDFFAARTLVRVFTACSTWSPFFAGMAVVLTYVDNVPIHWVIVSGFPFMLITLFAVDKLARRFNADQVSGFVGYPLRLDSLWVPVVLATLVISFSRFAPSLSILAVIAIAALALTLITLMVSSGLLRTAAIGRRFICEELPRSVNEVTLFLAAGVLSAGLIGLVDIGIISPPLNSFSTLNAAQVLAVMIVISACGIHPLIQISGLTPILLVVDPAPSLLALTFLFAWGLGTCASPLSGTNLVFQGRYDISAVKLAIHNWGYVAMMYCVAVLLLFAHTAIFLNNPG